MTRAETGIRLARSGRLRAVLCEKPFTTTAAEAGARLRHRPALRRAQPVALPMVATLRGETPEYDLVGPANARLYLEMALLAHAAHIAGARVPLPLEGGATRSTPGAERRPPAGAGGRSGLPAQAVRQQST